MAEDRPVPGPVRPIRPGEREAWCACPKVPGEPGFAVWLEQERAWADRWHPEDRYLFVYDQEGRLHGKYDVPLRGPRGWELWAPTVGRGPGARSVMPALCLDLVGRARAGGVSRVEVILERGHAHRDLALRCLVAAGFEHRDERAVFARDLEGERADAAPARLELRPAGCLDLGGLRRLHERCGGDPHAVEPDTARRPAALVAWFEGAPVCLALPRTGPRDEVLTLLHFGLVREARGRGLGREFFRGVIAAAREAGYRSYVGSTSKGNAAMLRLLEGGGFRRVGERTILTWRPRAAPR